MKTIDQIAEAAGVTKAAIYKRFQSYGLSVNQLNSEKQGRTKVYGDDIERLIILMFKPNDAVESSVNSTNGDIIKENEELKEKIELIEVENKAIKGEMEKAEARADKSDARAERAEMQVEILLNQVDKLTDAIRAAEAVQAAQIRATEAAQAAQMTQISRLPASTAENTKRGILERLLDKIARGGKE